MIIASAVIWLPALLSIYFSIKWFFYKENSPLLAGLSELFCAILHFVITTKTMRLLALDIRFLFGEGETREYLYH